MSLSWWSLGGRDKAARSESSEASQWGDLIEGGDGTEALEPRLQQRLVQQELLQLLARQRRRSPYPVLLCSAVIAAMAMQVGSWLWPLLWMAAVIATLVLRYVLLGRLPTLTQRSLEERLRWGVWLNLLSSLVFCVSLAFGGAFTEYQRMVQTILLLGMCAGAVATTAGHRASFAAFLCPIIVVSGLSWITGFAGHHVVRWPDGLLALLMLIFGGLLLRLADEGYKVFAESVLIRHQQARSNQQLRQALQRTEQAMQAKTRFLAAASHDLRQPMHTLTLLGSTLLRRRLDEDSHAIVRNMNLAIESLSTQMDALLDISKLDAQVVAVNARVFNLGDWLGRLHQEFLPEAQRKRLELTLICPHDAYVDTDPMLLERVVRNLIDNAIKYTQAGLVSIVADRRDGLWHVSVRDTGMGIAKQEQHRVFEEFYQIGNRERDRAKGLGLGLSIVSRLVDLLDLHLSLSSTVGLGSCFTLSIEAVEFKALPPTASRPSERSLQGLRVLVVDDEELVRMAMCSLLRELGCSADGVGSTREALLSSMRQRPDIVLVDYRLKGKDDGLMAVRTLRNAVPGLPALLISGDTAPQRLRDAQEAGLRLLHKPLPADVLIAAMREALAQRPQSAAFDPIGVQGLNP